MKKILVAEDDIFLANAYRVKLTNSGFEIKLCADGNEVINTLKDYMPDLILLDLIMPGKDGFTVLKEIKENEIYKNIPVIIASNLGQQQDIDKGMQLGAKDFIVKSNSSLTEIIAKINNALN